MGRKRGSVNRRAGVTVQDLQKAVDAWRATLAARQGCLVCGDRKVHPATSLCLVYKATALRGPTMSELVRTPGMTMERLQEALDQCCLVCRAHLRSWYRSYGTYDPGTSSVGMTDGWGTRSSSHNPRPKPEPSPEHRWADDGVAWDLERWRAEFEAAFLADATLTADNAPDSVRLGPVVYRRSKSLITDISIIEEKESSAVQEDAWMDRTDWL